MTELSQTMTAAMAGRALDSVWRNVIIGLIAFLTVVDLFATQAILPSLAEHYGVTPAAMGFAVNASTLGMAVAGLAVAFFSRHLNRRLGILIALCVLAIPTALLASAPDLANFTILRIAQGLCMASAFTLTLAYLGEECSPMAAGSAFAAYITGNVASNLIGRLISAGVADHFGLAANFYFFAALNIAGAGLVALTLRSTVPTANESASFSLAAWMAHLRNPTLRAAFGIGFCILFVFIGTFTYVNFVLVREPLSLSPMTLGLVYLVFLPSVITTPFAGVAVQQLGTRPTFWISLAIAGLGLLLLLLPNLPGILIGLTLIGIGTFLAQAAATGFVGRAATTDRGAASGIYLASYFFGGLIGSFVLGQLFDRFGWEACVGGIAVAVVIAGALAAQLKTSPDVSRSER